MGSRLPHMVVVGGTQRPQASRHAADLHPVRMAQERQLDGEHGQHLQEIPAGPETLFHIVGIVEDVFPLRVEPVVGPDHIVVGCRGVLGRIMAPYSSKESMIFFGERHFAPIRSQSATSVLMKSS